MGFDHQREQQRIAEEQRRRAANAAAALRAEEERRRALALQRQEQARQNHEARQAEKRRLERLQAEWKRIHLPHQDPVQRHMQQMNSDLKATNDKIAKDRLEMKRSNQQQGSNPQPHDSNHSGSGDLLSSFGNAAAAFFGVMVVLGAVSYGIQKAGDGLNFAAESIGLIEKGESLFSSRRAFDPEKPVLGKGLSTDFLIPARPDAQPPVASSDTKKDSAPAANDPARKVSPR